MVKTLCLDVMFDMLNDPMVADYISERNTTMVDIDDPGVAITGYGTYI